LVIFVAAGVEFLKFNNKFHFLKISVNGFLLIPLPNPPNLITPLTEELEEHSEHSLRYPPIFSDSSDIQNQIHSILKIPDNPADNLEMIVPPLFFGAILCAADA
jgi:hypothetical protein